MMDNLNDGQAFHDEIQLAKIKGLDGERFLFSLVALQQLIEILQMIENGQLRKNKY
jgi:hypothetical protein